MHLSMKFLTVRWKLTTYIQESLKRFYSFTLANSSFIYSLFYRTMSHFKERARFFF